MLEFPYAGSPDVSWNKKIAIYTHKEKTMYQQRANGGFRSRASFPITPEQIQGLNVICEKTGLSFSALCSCAVNKIIADYVQNGSFTYPESAKSALREPVSS